MKTLLGTMLCVITELILSVAKCLASAVDYLTDVAAGLIEFNKSLHDEDRE